MGNQNITICPNANYTEDGYTAIDNYDGDITDKVQVRNENNKVTYQVTDSSGNTAKITRTITKEDKTKPSITLKGNQNQTIYLGTSWQEPGYTASDNCEGDITNKVVVNRLC